ncbi:hypothetical protein SNE40_003582 [Patella caerulea]|uniref:Uncharacterized protein n=1 Tax=Patella caerulea TaxID=87958 RepID=A0AAN8K853_PATCE
MLSLQLFVVLLPALVLASESSWLDSLMSNDAENHADLLQQLKRHLSYGDDDIDSEEDVETRGFRGRGRRRRNGFVRSLKYVCFSMKMRKLKKVVADKKDSAKKMRGGFRKGRFGARKRRPTIDFEKYEDLGDAIEDMCEEFKDYLVAEKKSRKSKKKSRKSKNKSRKSKNKSKKSKPTTASPTVSKREFMESPDKQELLNHVLALLQESI